MPFVLVCAFSYLIRSSFSSCAVAFIARLNSLFRPLTIYGTSSSVDSLTHIRTRLQGQSASQLSNNGRLINQSIPATARRPPLGYMPLHQQPDTRHEMVIESAPPTIRNISQRIRYWTPFFFSARNSSFYDIPPAAGMAFFLRFSSGHWLKLFCFFYARPPLGEGETRGLPPVHWAKWPTRPFPTVH